MSGETDQALEMHNKYAQFQLNASACFTPGTSENLGGWEKIDKTIHLKPFLVLLVREFKSKLGKTFSFRSLEVANANWIGNEVLLEETFSPRDLILGIYNNNKESLIARRYLDFSARLEGLKLVTNHMGVVILDSAIEWLKIITTRHDSEKLRLQDIQDNVISHINNCSVNTVKVTKENGVLYFLTSEVFFSEQNKSLVIRTLKSTRIPKVRNNLIRDWSNEEGIYVLHKGEIIDKVNEVSAKLIEKSRVDQIRYFNEFVRTAK